MDFHKVRIQTALDLRPDGTVVELDGLPVKGLVNIKFEHKCGSIASLTLQVYATDVELEGVAKVKRIKGERQEEL